MQVLTTVLNVLLPMAYFSGNEASGSDLNYHMKVRVIHGVIISCWYVPQSVGH